MRFTHNACTSRIAPSSLKAMLTTEGEVWMEDLHAINHIEDMAHKGRERDRDGKGTECEIENGKASSSSLRSSPFPFTFHSHSLPSPFHLLPSTSRSLLSDLLTSDRAKRWEMKEEEKNPSLHLTSSFPMSERLKT